MARLIGLFCDLMFVMGLGKKTMIAVSQDVGTNLISSHLTSKAVLQTSKNCGAIGGGERFIPPQAAVFIAHTHTHTDQQDLAKGRVDRDGHRRDMPEQSPLPTFKTQRFRQPAAFKGINSNAPDNIAALALCH